MIKANELRIGNWVDFSSVPVRGQIQWRDIGDTDNIEPILLTPEILGKCGFQKTRHERRGEGYRIFIMKSAKRYLVIYHELAMISGDGEDACLNFIEDLHQLQNLYFALTGEELNVNL